MSFAQEEILEEFAEIQEQYASERSWSILHAEAGSSEFGHRIPGGFHLFCAPGKTAWKTPQRKAYNRAFTALALHEQIRKRILAGERPKVGGRGRPPTRWWRVAEELGINIGQPKAAAPTEGA